MSELNKEQQAFLNEFNWHNYSEGIDAVDQKNPPPSGSGGALNFNGASGFSSGTGS